MGDLQNRRQMIKGYLVKVELGSLWKIAISVTKPPDSHWGINGR